MSSLDYEKDSLEPFLAPGTDDGVSLPSEPKSLFQKRRIWHLLHFFFLGVYTLVFIFIITELRLGHKASDCPIADPNLRTYSPARVAISHTPPVIFDTTPFNNVFTGNPRPEHNKAWHNLLKNIHIRIPGDALEQLNRTSLELRDGSGYAGMLGVYHELHCLKTIRHLLHQDFYPEDFTPEKLPEAVAHVDHCLEFLRRNAMCTGNLDLVTFEWLRNGPLPVFDAPRYCVDWERLDGWAGEHQLDLFETEKFVGGEKKPS